VTPVRSLVGLAALTAIVLALTAAGLGADAFTAAAALAVIPLPFYIGIALWLDRFEPEPERCSRQPSSGAPRSPSSSPAW
jgi:hypothetical protein